GCLLLGGHRAATGAMLALAQAARLLARRRLLLGRALRLLRLGRRGFRHLLGGLRHGDTGLLQERAHLVRSLGADAEPVLRLLDIDLELRLARLRIVEAELSDEAPVAGAARIGDHDAEGRILLGTDALEPNDDCHEVPFSLKGTSKGPKGARGS